MDSTTVQTTVSTVSQIFDALSARFGATGLHLWEAMVRYEFYSAAFSIGVVVFLSVVMFFVTKKVWELYSENQYDYEGAVIAATFGAVVMAVALMICLSTMGPILLSPEAAVIYKLIP